MNAFNKTVRKTTLLRQAISRGNLSAAKSLLAVDSTLLKTKDKRGCTPLFIAVMDGRVEIARLFIEAGAALDEKNGEHGMTPLIFAADRSPEMVRLLVDKGANLDQKDNNGFTAMDYAARGNNKETRIIFEGIRQQRLEEAATRRKQVMRSAVVLQRDLRCRSPFKRKIKNGPS